tara:strand:- start:7007 stop:8947 length:1941 start_codon:yes stop_codon:yes gene_type:complete
MAEAKKKLILEVDMETGEITKGLDNINKDLEKTGDKAKAVGKKGGKGFGALSKGLKMGAKGFGVLGKAIAATGIGAIVLVIAGLVKKLMTMKPVMDAIEKATAFMGGAFTILADIVIDVGEWLYWAFNSPQEALDIVNQKLNDFWSWIKSIGTIITTSFQIAMKQLSIKLKEAAIATKEFFGLDASELKAEIQSIEAEIDALRIVQADAVADFQAPFIAMSKVIKKVVDDMLEAGEAALDLASKFIKLRDKQRLLNLEIAKGVKEIAELKKQSDDITLSTEERIKATQDAAKLEEELRVKRASLMAEEISLLKQEQKLQGENEERTNAINALLIAQQVIIQEGVDLEANAIQKVTGLLKEKEDARKEFFQNQKDRIDELGGIHEKEVQELAEYYADQLLLAEQYGFDTASLLQAQLDETAAMEDRHRAETRAKESAEREAKKQAVLNTAKAVLSNLAALNEAFSALSIEEVEANELMEAKIEAETDEAKKKQLIAQNKKLLDAQAEQQKKAFDRGKKLKIAEALISTYQGATSAFTSLAGIPVVGPVLGGLAAAAAVAGGLAQVMMIKKQKFSGGTGGTTTYTAPTPSSASSSSAPTSEGSGAPQLDLSFLGGGDSSNIQAYVISNEVTNSQQSDQLINDQASLVG